jgi:hypothetical protein
MTWLSDSPEGNNPQIYTVTLVYRHELDSA